MLFGEFLVEREAVTDVQLSEALMLQRQRRMPITTIAVNLGVVLRSQELQLRRRLDQELAGAIQRALTEFGLSSEQIDKVQEEFRNSADPIGAILVQQGYLESGKLVSYLKDFSSRLTQDRARLGT